MYYNEHQPPHFHAEYAEHVAEIDIESLEVSRGYLPGRVLGLVLEWASLHRDELRENWKRARAQEQVQPIAPLA